MKDKKWIITEYDENAVFELSKALSLSPLCTRLLIKRGYSDVEKAKAFLSKDISGFHSPFLMKDMEKSTKIIKHAICNNYKTLVWGDYDVDGVTASTILYKYFYSLGLDVDYYIPRRLDEGYGLNTDAIERFAKDGGKLLVTVDCGITADEEIRYAHSLGLTVIVTDHHECREVLPDADAVVNPKRHDCSYPFKELAGVGVAFKLICACEMVLKSLSHVDALKIVLDRFSDLTSIGTIADVMPIADENRLIVNKGLIDISNTDNVGLSALIDDAGVYSKSYKKRKISSTTIGFVLAPKINAAGRMGTSRSAVDLFLTDSREKAAELADELTRINKDRQQLENEILNEALVKIENEFDFEHDKVIILSDNDWHHGVIGIVASRITEKYNLPAILVSFKNEGHEMTENLGKGSGRSIRGFNIVEALNKCSDVLLKFGGHELAAGLSVDRENFDEFKRRMNVYANEAFSKIDNVKSIDIDCRIDASEISIETALEIFELEPFGLSNPVPIFCAENMLIVSVVPIGENKHTKITLKKDGRCFTALFFGRPASTLPYMEGDVIDAVFNIDVNTFKNQQTVQMIIRDLRLNREQYARIEAGYTRYNQISLNPSLPIKRTEVPTRDDFKAVYTLLRTIASDSANSDFEVNIPYLSRIAKKRFGVDVSPLKAFIVFDVFSEAGLFTSKPVHTDEYVRVINLESFVNGSNMKTELSQTRIMKQLISRIKTKGEYLG